MRNIRRIMIAIVAFVTLAACQASSPPRSTGGIAQGETNTTVTKVVLTDGTPCAVIDTDHSAAVGCDWGTVEATMGDTPQGDGTTKVTLVVLENGVRCAVMDSTAKALDCGWGAKHSTPTPSQTGENGARIDTFPMGGVTCAMIDGTAGKNGTKGLSCGTTAEPTASGSE